MTIFLRLTSVVLILALEVTAASALKCGNSIRSLDSLRSLLPFDSLNIASTFVDRSNVPSKSQVITKFGQDVAVCSTKHGGRFLSSEELEPYRMVGDPPMDELMEFMDREGWPLKPGDDLLEKDKYPSHVQERIDVLLKNHQDLPSWVDKEQLQRGQRVFLRFLPAASLSLFYRSLVLGFNIPKIGAVIQSTGYLAPPSTPEQVTFRLVDTGALLGSCMSGIDNLVPGEEGWKMCLYVRVLHAKVRRSLLRRTGARSWKTSEFGVPINQEDMAATLLAFSVNTLEGIESIGGVELPRQEQEDYLALWRYIGWLLGVSTIADHQSSNALRPLDPCGPGLSELKPDPIDHAKCMLQSILLHLVAPDQSSVIISHHLLKLGRPARINNCKNLQSKEEIAKSAATLDFGFHFRASVFRSLIGAPLADALKLPFHPQFLTRILIHCQVRAYLWAFRIVTWAAFWEAGRTGLERYCVLGMRKFHTVWTERHQSRMALALKTKAPCCPFSMVTRQ